MLSPVGYTPSQIEHAYGYDKVSFDVDGVAVPGDGRGETVALFEVGYTPGLSQDLAVFDRAFDLRDLTSWPLGGAQPVAPFLRTIGFDGGDTIPADESDQSEALLDVEWLHADAPAANILIVEAAQSTDLAQADAFAASQPGVVVSRTAIAALTIWNRPRRLATTTSSPPRLATPA
jgi:subtilase family serine protease